MSPPRRNSATTGRLRRRRTDAGASAVEFALVLPMFLMIVFGVIEYGWVFYQQFNLASAVRDGLRQGVTCSQTGAPDPQSQAVTVAKADLQRLGVAAADVSLTTSYAGSAPTKTMTLSGTLTYHKMIGMVPTPARLHYSMTMMLELQ